MKLIEQKNLIKEKSMSNIGSSKWTLIHIKFKDSK